MSLVRHVQFPRWLRILILICGVFLAYGLAHAQVRISEVMWMGSDVSTADEWLELGLDPKFGIAEIDLSGWKISSRKSTGEEAFIVTFQTGTLLHSGAYLVVGNFPASTSRLSNDPDVISSSVSLPNTKLLLKLFDAADNLIDTVDDGIGDPLAGSNVSGQAKASMQRIGENWMTATESFGFDEGVPIFGSPGKANDSFPLSSSSSLTSSSSSSSPSSLILTEVLANPIGNDDEEWIELANTGSGTVNIGGITLTDDSVRFDISESGSLLSAGEHRSFRKSLTGISLGNQGDTINIVSGSAILDSWTYPETAEEVSFGRDASNPSVFRTFCVPTEGQLNEVMSLNPQIAIQSGNTQGIGKLSLNVEASVAAGSLTSATCRWDFADGTQSDRCNPPSHTFTGSGRYAVRLTVTTMCEETIERTLDVIVTSPEESDIETLMSQTEEGECVPTQFSDVILSEFFPNPIGTETEEEWIELQNQSGKEISLCGWSLDDGEEGSKPYALDGFVIEPSSLLLLSRKVTGIALNNDAETVRLMNPNGKSELASYTDAPAGESFALRNDGLFVWTPYLTPLEQNRFRTAERAYDGQSVIVSAALPNPEGRDDLLEWIEITNVGEEIIFLDGWSLDNRTGGSEPFSLSGVSLEPKEVRRFGILETGISLTNTSDTARLLDPDGFVESLVSWENAVDGRIYRPAVLLGERIPARVTRVIDGDTFEIILTDIDHLDRVPSALKRRWLLVSESDTPVLTVRLIGIDTPETVHPHRGVEEFGLEASSFTKALVEGKNIDLLLEEELWDRYDRLLAYAYTQEDESVQERLLRHGLASVYTRFPFVFREEFLAYESEAESAKLGIWSDGTVSEFIVMEREQEELEILLEAGSGALQSDMTEEIFDDRVVRYQTGVTVSEIYPAPDTKNGEDEWIELYNPTSQAISLAGWLLDDERNEGSRPWMIPAGVTVLPHDFIILAKAETGLSLNNDGDEIWLLSPDGSVAVGGTYQELKKRQSFSFDSSCVSDLPTPGARNICRTLLVAQERSVPPVQKVTSRRSSQTSFRDLKVRYRHIIDDADAGSGSTLTSKRMQELKFDPMTAPSPRESSNVFAWVERLLTVLAAIGGENALVWVVMRRRVI